MDAETKRRLDALEARVRRLESQAVADASAATAQAAASPASSTPVRGPASASGPGLQWLPLPDEPRAAPATPRRTVAPANWLALAGILVLGLGMVFFLKLAYDRGWVPLGGRFAIGVAGGLGLWLLGDLLRRRVHTGFVQALVAGGAAIAYITLYVGYASPGYREALGITLPIELALLGALAVLLAGYALWRGYEAMGAVAVALSTILLAPAGDFSTAGVLYAVVLDTALMLAALWRGWPSIVWTALVGANVTIAFGLGADVAWQVLLGSLLLVNGLAVAAAARDRGQASSPYQVAGSILLAAIETGFVLDDAGVDSPFAWSLLAFGALGLVLALLLRRRGMATGIVAAGLLAAWPLLHFEDARVRLAAYIGLAVAALAIDQAWRPSATRMGARIVGVVMWGLALIQLFIVGADGLFDDSPGTALPLAACVAVGGLAQWGLQRRHGPELAAASLAAGLASILVSLAYALEGWVITVSWAILGLAVVVAGLAARVAELRLASFALFAFVLVRIFTFDVAALTLVGRVLAFLATGALLLVAAFLYARNRKAPALPTPPR